MTPMHAGCSRRCLAKQPRSAQLDQILRMLPTLQCLAGNAPGKFLEMGALDGVYLSNTLLLESCCRWHGTLVEGNPSNFGRLNSTILRPASQKIYGAACADGVGSIEMTAAGGVVAGQVGVGSLGSEATSHTGHLNAFGIRLRGDGRPRDTVRVPCWPLNAILAGVGQETTDFFSLDGECDRRSHSGPEHRLLLLC